MKKTIISLVLVSTLFVTAKSIPTASATELKVTPPVNFDIFTPQDERQPGTGS